MTLMILWSVQVLLLSTLQAPVSLETSQDSMQENLQGECECPSVSQFTQHITDLDNAWSFPTPVDMSSPTFTWGSLDAQAFIAAISQAYDEVIHWRPNLFLVPFGNVGSRFI